MPVSAILTDIEGTTSSISFVKDVLFPYARRALPGFVRDHRDDPEVRRWLDVVATEHGSICSDDVIVETRTATYVYQLDNGGTDLIVPFTQTWVTDRAPVNPSGGIQPPPGSDRLITLFSCSEIFHTDNRSVVFGHLVRTIRAG